MERDIGKPVFDLLLLIASAAAFAGAMALPDIEIVGDLSPAFFPKLISAMIFLFAIPCLVKDVREWRAAAPSDGSQPANRRGVMQWLWIVGLTVVYILLFEPLGYIPSTTVFAFCCVIGLLFASGAWRELNASQRVKSLVGAVIFAIVLAVAIYYVFTNLFEIPLPD
ncbi:tripartite tricarboxylate transporter TctB family protein [Salinicola corii]|uniref:Tripartite tricarboxylate transporter TctB family protein n=1 Tax=Salinicola corii TaxID=2606937 RepID=A0A640W9Q0_9GAMM|nr:tripartite tricarboxylate transporter TctB family protein [Salinicola corii]KAA0016041.1 tripartite tricarboxylate transporter TctB family protein [Salinicola corii]